MQVNALVPHCYWCQNLPVDNAAQKQEVVVPIEQEMESIVPLAKNHKIMDLARSVFKCDTFIEAAKFLNTFYLQEPSRVQDWAEDQRIELKGRLTHCDRNHLLGLLYLAQMQAEDNKCPLPENASKAFIKSQELDDKTRLWVGWRAVAVLALLSTAGGVGTGVASRVTFSKDSDKNKDEQVATIILISVAATFLLAYLGLVWTGTNPVNATALATIKERHAEILRGHFKNLASTLVNLYQNERKLAKEIAKTIDLKDIRSRIKKMVGNEDVDALLHLHLLEQAVIYVKSKGLAMPLDLSLQLVVSQGNKIKK